MVPIYFSYTQKKEISEYGSRNYIFRIICDKVDGWMVHRNTQSHIFINLYQFDLLIFEC